MGTVQKNFIYNVIYQILVILLPLITAPYISRTLGATAVGIYSYTNSVAYYFLMIAMLGISNHGNRSIAAIRDNKSKLNTVFSSIYILQLFTYSIAVLLYVLYIVFFVSDNKVIALLQLLYVISGLLDISWLFFGLEKFRITVGRNAIIKICTVWCMFIFVHTPDDLWKYTLIMSGGTFLSQAYLWMFVGKEVKFVKVSINDIVRNVRPVLILFIPVVSYSIYKVLGKIMLGNMSSYEQVGYFQSAEKIINIPMGVITALGTVMLPRMSNLIAKGDSEKTNQYIRVSFKFVTIIGSAIAFGLIGVTNVLTPVFFGIDFLPTAPIISLLSLTVFAMAWANVIRTQYLIPYGLDKVYLTSTIIGAVFNLLINALLIPQFHAIGASIGTIVAEFSVMIVQIIAIRKKLPVLQYYKSVIPTIIIGIIMAVIVRIIGDSMGVSIVTLIIQIAVGGCVYLILLGLTLFIFKDEIWVYFSNWIKARFYRE